MKSETHICTIASTRPELIRLSRIIAKLDESCNHTLIYTGQNYDPKLSTIFFDELGIRKPNLYITKHYDTFGEQLGHMLDVVDGYLSANKPDKILILGDTNGCLCAIVAKRLGIPLIHAESGNRCKKWIHEEINRHIVDHISDIHLPYTTLSKQNLLDEGINNTSIFVTGNPIGEVLSYYASQIDSSTILTTHSLISKQFLLATFHRNENVTDEGILKHIIYSLNELYKMHKLPIICSIHPKTRTNLTKFKIEEPYGVRFLEPVGFFAFAKLEKHARVIISDSGTCPEEGTILGTPSVIIRETTERPELLQCGSVILSGTKSCDIINAVTLMMNSDKWNIPEGYDNLHVSDIIVKLLIGNSI